MKKFALLNWQMAALSLLLTLATPAVTLAETVLERVERTGVLTAGARTDAIPFSFQNENGEFVGYSVDILNLIRENLEAKLGKPIRLELVEINTDNRFEQVSSGAIDIECSSTSFSWQREQLIDFSITYFITGTQLLTSSRSGLGSVTSLTGKRIGVIPETTNEQTMQMLSGFTLVRVANREEGLQALERGDIDAFASDGIILFGLKQQATNPDRWEVVPKGGFYSSEPYACMIPEDNSEWRDLVNFTLVQYMQGLVDNDVRASNIYDRWFGPQGVVTYPRQFVIRYFELMLDTLERIPQEENPLSR